MRCAWLELHREVVDIYCAPTTLRMFNTTSDLPATNSTPDHIHLPATGEFEFQGASKWEES